MGISHRYPYIVLMPQFVLSPIRSEQTKMLTEHESKMRNLLRRNEGVWFSDFWMKVLVIFLFVYTVVLGMVVYCST